MDHAITGIKHLHNVLRWAVLLLGIWAIVRASLGVMNKSEYTETDRKSALFLLIASHTQLLLGLLLYFLGPWFGELIHNTSEVMKTAPLRFFVVEHFFGMLLAIVMVHIGYTKTKRHTEADKKFRSSLIYFSIGLIIILLSIPWPFLQGSGRPLFPGM